MARYSPFTTNLDPVRKLPVKTAVTVVATVVFFKCLFSCPCASPEETIVHCWLYLLLPVGIMLFILILVDTQLLKLCQCYVCRCCARAEGRCCSDSVECCCCAGGHCYRPTHCGEEVRYYCALIGGYLLRVFCASALWIVVALVDGDWYVCIRTVTVNGTGPQQIACKDLPTPEEAETLRKYSSESRIIALVIILGLSFLLVVNTAIMTRWKPYYKSVFEAYVEQETEATLDGKLHEQAVERAKLLSESVLHCVHSQHENNRQEEGHIQYQPLTETEENMWRRISHPAFHLLGVRIHS
ncbi:hypothetical protein KOW79_005290 [Hemibagrus wyckioides]|uniref:Uncharacterized protein n=1 Tax=Hemibagrus wyckioides TaxID=337641 RepID=A0A9D3NZD5_9TELE|nr:uncharacterized protein LOC131354525 [Hemibagrus wyckioides]KAG7331321.1 hypothetical protein KOW79_005290 [Hemibagrus wyckioides]